MEIPCVAQFILLQMHAHERSLSQISTRQLFLSDLHYSAWANHRMLDSCAAFTAEELEQDLRLSHRNILSTLQHICDAEKVWLDCLTTTASGGTWILPPGPAPKLTLDDLAQKWPELWQGYEKWLDELQNVASELEEQLSVKIPDGRLPRFQRWQILSHVLDHSQFHRGQVIAMIRILGHTPPAINRGDYWLAGGD
jgi:uncharacterized damage-inducible protein DinB